MPDAAIEVAGLTKRYGDQTVVDDVSFSVRVRSGHGLPGPQRGG